MATDRYLTILTPTNSGANYLVLNLGFSMKIPKDCRHVFELMKDDYVNLKFSTGTTIVGRPPVISYGDFIDMSNFYEDGDRLMRSRRYLATDMCYPEYNTATGGYDFDIRLEAEYMLWRNHIFMLALPTKDAGGNTIYKRREVKWSLTDTLENHAGQILRNLQALGFRHYKSFNPYNNKLIYEYYRLSIDTENVNSGARLVSYDNTDIISALDALCAEEAFDCEWWVTDGVLHFGKFGKGDGWDGREAVKFTLNGNVAEMSRSESETKYANRLYVLGGTQNLPDNYRRELVFTIDGLEEVDGVDLSVFGYAPDSLGKWMCYKLKDNIRPFSPDIFRFLPNVSFDCMPSASTTESAGWSYYSYKEEDKTETAEISFIQPGRDSDGTVMEFDGYYELQPKNIEVEAVVYSEDSGDEQKYDDAFASGLFTTTLEAVFSYKDSQGKRQELTQVIYDGETGKGGWPGRTILNYGELKYKLGYRMRITAKSGIIKSVRIKGGMTTAYISPWVDTKNHNDIGIADPFHVRKPGEGVNVLVTVEEQARMKPVILSMPGHSNQVHLVLNYAISPDEYAYHEHGKSGNPVYTEAYFMVYKANEDYGNDYFPKVGDRFTFNADALDYNAVPVSWYMYGDTESGTEIPAVVERRLQLPKERYPDGCIQSPLAGNGYEVPVVEDTLVIDDVFPQETWQAGKVDSEEKYDTTEYADGSSISKPYDEYTVSGITDAAGHPVFFSEKYLTAEELKIVFQSGLLAGLTFSVEFNPDGEPEEVRDDDGVKMPNADAQRYRIVRNEEYGRMLPDGYLYPKPGDALILTGWNPVAMDKLGLVSVAEAELERRAEEEMNIRMSDGSTYTVTAMSDAFFGLPLCAAGGVQLISSDRKEFYVRGVSGGILPAPGDSAVLFHPAWFGKDGSDKLRIIGHDIALDIPYDSPVYTVGRTPRKSRMRNIEKKITKIEQSDRK